MVILNVDAYCQECPHFRAVTIREDKQYSDKKDTVITCGNATLCKSIRNYLFDEKNIAINALKDLAIKYYLSLYVCSNKNPTDHVIRVIFYDSRINKLIMQLSVDPADTSFENFINDTEGLLIKSLNERK